MIDAHNLGTPPRSINLFDFRRFEALSERFCKRRQDETRNSISSISRALNPALDEGGWQCCNAMALPASSSKMAASELGFGVTPFRECELASIRERKRSSKPLSIALRRKIEEQGS